MLIYGSVVIGIIISVVLPLYEGYFQNPLPLSPVINGGNHIYILGFFH
jgi:hypothetical protein